MSVTGMFQHLSVKRDKILAGAECYFGGKNTSLKDVPLVFVARLPGGDRCLLYLKIDTVCGPLSFQSRDVI